ncbi:MAG: hypothetical protein JW754_04965 [Candidatus Aenigmarchaeota archaeon]|nr:hypothetical protein [Candidatus Aenigmarchaeota archaeon]
MKSVFIACSRRFNRDLLAFSKACIAEGIIAEDAGKVTDAKDTMESERSALLRAFGRIDNTDVLYVIAKEGYIGKTVAMEIAYAHARGKVIVSSEEIEELSARGLVSKVMKGEDLIGKLK